MAMQYVLICWLDLPFNFENIETILRKKEYNNIKYLDYITGKEISDLQKIITYFKEMQLTNDPIMINIIDKKYKEFYNLNFLNIDGTLGIAYTFYEEKIKKEKHYNGIRYPNIDLYLQILLDLVKDYLIKSITIYNSYE